MTSIKSSFIRRTSLCPPHERIDLPNPPMVDRSNVPKSITQHPRQRDQETANAQEQQNAVEEQRRSLFNAIETLKSWHKRSPIDNAKTPTYQSNINVQNNCKDI